MARYMMATKAMHQLGDISRKDPDLCVIYGEDNENFIGNWTEGFGFVDVKFPKSTTRDLTSAEKKEYDGMRLYVGDSPRGVIRTNPIERVMPEESPVIALPVDTGVEAQFRAKLAECRKLMLKFPYRAPEEAMKEICQIAVIGKLLGERKVSTWELSRELAREYGSSFNLDEFDAACGMAAHYCVTKA